LGQQGFEVVGGDGGKEKRCRRYYTILQFASFLLSDELINLYAVEWPLWFKKNIRIFLPKQIY
jgi:hypothetical protein